jgi:hypothetical protein
METEAQTTLLSPEATTETETTSTWYGEENAEVVQSKGWKTGDDAIKSYRELEKMSSGRVKMPTPESSAEEIRAFYQKTGCPENPDGYEISVPEGAEYFQDEATEGVLKEVAHEMGVSKQAFEKIVGAYYEKMAADMAQGREQGEAALKEEYGDKYEAELEIAKRFCSECSEEFQDLLVKSGLGNNPIFIKEFNGLGKKILSDTLIKGEVGNSDEQGYKPQYPNTPEMYASGEGEESVKARAWFTARGHVY